MNRTPEYTPWAITLLSGVVILGSILGCGLLDDSEEDDGPRCDSWNAQYIRVDGDVNLSIEAMEESVKEGSEGEEEKLHFDQERCVERFKERLIL